MQDKFVKQYREQLKILITSLDQGLITSWEDILFHLCSMQYSSRSIARELTLEVNNEKLFIGVKGVKKDTKNQHTGLYFCLNKVPATLVHENLNIANLEELFGISYQSFLKLKFSSTNSLQGADIRANIHTKAKIQRLKQAISVEGKHLHIPYFGDQCIAINSHETAIKRIGIAFIPYNIDTKVEYPVDVKFLPDGNYTVVCDSGDKIGNLTIENGECKYNVDNKNNSV